MNIIKQELRMGRKSLITWCLSLSGILLLFMLFYPTIFDQLEGFQKIFESFPLEFQKALGFDTLDLTNILSFYQFPFTYILVAGAVQAMNLGVSILSSEVREKTGDFIFVKPVTRHTIVSMKMLAILIQILITNIFIFLTALLTISLLSENGYNLKLFTLLTTSLFFIQIFFASFGLFISVFIKRIRSVLPISMGVVFLFYIIYLLNETLDDWTLKLISPFSYFNLSGIARDMNYDSLYLFLWFILVSLFIFLTFKLFSRKDLPSI